MAQAAVRFTVHGRVQGVFFRAFVAREAEALGLGGYVRNLPDGRSVEVFAEGEKEDLEKLTEQCRTGPAGARVEEVAENWNVRPQGLEMFEVRY